MIGSRIYSNAQSRIPGLEITGRQGLVSIAIMCILLALTAAASAGQEAMTYEFKFFVSSTVGLVPGQTGFLKAAILNTGSRPAKFKRYDPTNPIGGFGWDFNDPGLALGMSDISFAPGLNGSLLLAFGHVDPIVPRIGCCEGAPNLSNLSNVIIHPGDLLIFDLMSFWFAPTTPLGSMQRLRTSIQIDIGRPLFVGFQSDYFSVELTATEESVPGTLQEIPLTPFSFAPE